MNKKIVIDQGTSPITPLLAGEGDIPTIGVSGSILDMQVYVAGENVPQAVPTQPHSINQGRIRQRVLRLTGANDVARLEAVAFDAAQALRDWYGHNDAQRKAGCAPVLEVVRGCVARLVNDGVEIDGVTAWVLLDSDQPSQRTVDEYRGSARDFMIWCAERGMSPAECGSADLKSFKAWLQADGAPEQMERMRARWYGREARIKYESDWRGPAALAMRRAYAEAVRDAQKAQQAAARAGKKSKARLVRLADWAVRNCRGLVSMMLTLVASYGWQARAVSTERYSSDTIALRITLVRNFFKMALSRQGVFENPAIEIKVGKSKTSRRDRALSRYFSDEEVAAVLAECDEERCHTSYEKALAARNKAMLALQAVEGLRVSEVSHLDVSDYNRAMGDFGAIEIRASKGDKSRMVPLTEKMQAVLERHLAYRALLNPQSEAMFVSMNHGARQDVTQPGERIDPRSIRAMFDGIQFRLGIKRPGRSNHGLRHRFGTKAIRNGGNLYAVSAHMGHSQITTTQVYVEMAAFEDENVSKLTDNVL